MQRFYNILIVVFLLLMPVIGFSQVDETYLSSAIEKLNKNDVKGSIGDTPNLLLFVKQLMMESMKQRDII
ncbi:MAG: hypothetical protein IPH74_15695 [Bacteroidetes bacterium]|nr:hypothetical protein [Bacteroidota bacterium]